MSKHTLHGFITHTTYPWHGDKSKPIINFAVAGEAALVTSEYTVPVRQHSIEVDVPDNFNPNPLKVAAMRAKIDKIKIAAYEEVTNLQQEIEKLLCLSYEAPSANAVFDDVPQDAIDLNTVSATDEDGPQI